MCFTSSDRTSDPAPKPVQIPQHQVNNSNSNSSAVPQPKATMPQDYAPPQGPPPSHRANADYAPPPGPPPSHRQQQQEYAPPSGPPPNRNNTSNNNPFLHSNDDYIRPPPGPPPNRNSSSNNPFLQHDDYMRPPPGPPPPQQQQQQQQHDWQSAVPDTALLPPPPDFFAGFERSPANNATEEDAEAGRVWCEEYGLYPSARLDAAAARALANRNINVFAPPGRFTGQLRQLDAGVWKVETPRRQADVCLATYPPLYNVNAHAGAPRPIYYEVRILAGSSSEVGLAIGFAAPPYPSFRLPGWHRASLGVHGDDGHRFVADPEGGRAFTAPFRPGQTVGIGMEIRPQGDVQVFFTRDGKEQGRWFIHEETDAALGESWRGLDGDRDLCASIGMFGKVELEVVFARSRWAFTPKELR
ncbi:SPRY domain-containing protein [Xylariomycetidae sp. FL0641]|nr:SPRY domain-containing protein [Xylariomycetidae sp. FL0641]